MIYLIGGPPKCGKTMLAKLLSKSLGIPWVSADALQNAIKPYIADQDFAENFPLSAMKYHSNDQKYARHSASEIIATYRQQARTVYGAIEAFANSELIDGNDYAIEGYQVEPDLMARLNSEHPGKIRSIVVVKKDSNKLAEGFRKSTTPNDWILTKTKDEATFPKIATMIAQYSVGLEGDANKHGVKTICLDGDFETQLGEAMLYLANAN